MNKSTKKVEEKAFSKADMIDQIKVIVEKFDDTLKQKIEGVDMKIETMQRHMDERFDDVDHRFGRLENRMENIENRMENVEFELSQVKDVVLDIQQEKAPREDVLALAKRVTKIEMNDARAARK